MRGEVVAVPLRGLPFLLREGMRVCLTPPDLRRDRWCTVEAVSGERDGGRIVSLSCSHGLGDAEALLGKTVLACADDLELDVLDLRDDEIVGRAVVDEAMGPLGTVARVMETPAHDIWVVDGPHGEVMVPVVEEFVLDVPEEGDVRVAIPDGLVGL